MHYLSLSMIISSSVLILVIASLRRLLRGRISLRLQYALWLLVALRLLLPFDIGSLDFSVSSLTRGQALEQRLAGVSLPVTTPREVMSEASVSAGSGPAATDTPAAGITGPATAAQERQAITLTDILYMIWLTGAVLLALWQAGVNIRFARRLKREALPYPAEESRLPVYVAASLSSPCLFGIFRPRIYLNQPVRGERRQHILLHEQCHFAHGDHIWALLRALCLSLHWFNPLVWWAAALSRRDAELACDEAVMTRLGETQRQAYGETLLSLISR